MCNILRLTGLVGVLFAAAAVQGQTISGDPSLSLSVFSSGLSSPTGMRFTGTGSDFFAIEKNTGKVRLVQGATKTDVLDLPVDSDSERGLLGIELDPQFSSNHFVYLYYSRSTTAGDTQGSWQENRLSRFTYSGTSLGSESILMSIPSDVAQSNGPNHDGGPLRFGPDGMLYGVTGDLNRSRLEQNNGTLSSSSGGIYRLRSNGTIPDGVPPGETANPFLSSNPAFHKWFAYGVRNSFGMAFDPVTGALWATENGPSSMDEINRVASGFNSGWSKLMGPDSLDPQGVADLSMLAGATYSDPEFSFSNPIGVTSLAFLHGSRWGSSYNDAVLVGANNTGELYLLRLNAARDGFVLVGALADLVADSPTERNLIRFGSSFGVVTDIQIGADGTVYIMSLDNGAVYAVVPEPSTLALLATTLILGAAFWTRRRERQSR